MLDEHGEVVRMVGFRRISPRKLADQALRESEANLRDLFQQSPDIIMTVDRKGTILLMNRSIPALPAERAVGRNSLALMPYGFASGTGGHYGMFSRKMRSGVFSTQRMMASIGRGV